MSGFPILEAAERREGGTQLSSGRPSRLTPEKAALVVAGLREGKPYTACAARVGVTPKTLTNWRARGADPEAHPAYQEFAHACDHALAEHEARLLANIADAATGSGSFKGRAPAWQASAWLLERDARFQGRYARLSTRPNDLVAQTQTVEFVLDVSERRRDPTQGEILEIRRARENRRRAIEGQVLVVEEP